MALIRLNSGTRAVARVPRLRSSRSIADLENRLVELAKLDLTALRWAWHESHGRDAPTGLSREFLLRHLSHRLQVHALGDLDGKIRRTLDRLAGGDLSVIAASIGPGMNLRPGTLLVREYKDEMHRVTVLEEGYSWAWKDSNCAPGSQSYELCSKLLGFSGTKAKNSNRLSGSRMLINSSSSPAKFLSRTSQYAIQAIQNRRNFLRGSEAH